MLLARALIRISGTDLYPWPAVFIFAIFAAGRWLLGRQDHQLIRENLQEHGCEVQSISWDTAASMLAGRNERTYRVLFYSSKGKEQTASCVVSLVTGVKWLGNGPSGSGRFRAREDETECTCLSCGAVMPPHVKRCKKCGWSYQS